MTGSVSNHDQPAAGAHHYRKSTVCTRTVWLRWPIGTQNFISPHEKARSPTAAPAGTPSRMGRINADQSVIIPPSADPVDLAVKLERCVSGVRNCIPARLRKPDAEF